MNSICIVYFSGTGNSQYVAYKFYEGLIYDKKSIVSIEDTVDFDKAIANSEDVMIVYPIVGGNMPYIMREFLRRYQGAFYGKNLITIVTQAGFSGDGGALAYRYLGSDKVIYKASYHINMPTNVSFGKFFTIKNGEDIRGKVDRANKRIENAISELNNGIGRRHGSSKLSYMIGYHLQRKQFMRMEEKLRKKFSVDGTLCIQCLKCIHLCPMENIRYENGKIIGNDNCTLCYRCLHACPKNAISLIRHESVQYKGVKSGL